MITNLAEIYIDISEEHQSEQMSSKQSNRNFQLCV